MLKTVKDACEIHPMALDYAMTEQIENLSSVIDKTEKEAEAFFDQNFITKGMGILLGDGLRRLAGRSDQAVFELRQAMGGGKTHSMVALGLLAKSPALRESVVPEIASSAPFGSGKVIAINGRLGFEEHFLWGEIAHQMGRASEFSKFWRDGAKAPSERDWIDLIEDESTLILLDELPPYFDYAVTRQVGAGTLAQVTTYALSNLLTAATKLKRCCIVLSNLSGSYEGATRQLRQAIANFQQEANRQARSITPVELASDEIYEILRKRLFRRVPDRSVIDAVAASYSQALSEAARSKSIAKSAEQIADEIYRSYPFHPSVKHVISLFRENESYRQTRGLMQFISKMLRSTWERPQNDVYLIGCQHLNLNIEDVREEIKRISDLQDAIAHDIAANGEAVAEMVDANLSSDAGSQIATLLLTASLSEAVDAVKGLTKQELLECLW
jgi:predicted AAA+ superfamily ATPase